MSMTCMKLQIANYYITKPANMDQFNKVMETFIDQTSAQLPAQDRQPE